MRDDEAHHLVFALSFAARAPRVCLKAAADGRVCPRRVAEVPLADGVALVAAGAREHLCNGGRRLRNRRRRPRLDRLYVLHAVAEREARRHDSRARRAAYRLRVEVLQPDTGICGVGETLGDASIVHRGRKLAR